MFFFFQQQLQADEEEEIIFTAADLSHLPDEERKKVLRRQRNKEAAARCRKRRLDQTLSLEDQVHDWELKTAALRREIEALAAQENSLLAVLEKHKKLSKCKLFDDGGSRTKTNLNNNGAAGGGGDKVGSKKGQQRNT